MGFLVLGSQGAVVADASSSVAPATPVGILLKTVRIGEGVNVPGSSSNQPRERLVFANAQSRTLYIYDEDKPGQSSCYGECAQKWPPAEASEGAQAAGDWSI
ncbi:MAG: hypothetical protein RLN70_01610, partial [Rhodospirillaceae bacterium]